MNVWIGYRTAAPDFVDEKQFLHIFPDSLDPSPFVFNFPQALDKAILG